MRGGSSRKDGGSVATTTTTTATIGEEEEEEDEDHSGSAMQATIRKKKKTSAARAKKKDSAAAAAAAAASASSSNAAPNLAMKVCSALEEDILCLSRDASMGLLPDCTIFSMSEEGNLAYIVQMMRRDCPGLCKDRRKLLLDVLSMLPDDEGENAARV